MSWYITGGGGGCSSSPGHLAPQARRISAPPDRQSIGLNDFPGLNFKIVKFQRLKEILCGDNAILWISTLCSCVSVRW